VCEFLHCTKNELRKRIKTDADYYTILAYIKEKSLREKKAMEDAENEQKNKNPRANK